MKTKGYTHSGSSPPVGMTEAQFSRIIEERWNQLTRAASRAAGWTPAYRTLDQDKVRRTYIAGHPEDAVQRAVFDVWRRGKWKKLDEDAVVGLLFRAVECDAKDIARSEHRHRSAVKRATPKPDRLRRSRNHHGHEWRPVRMPPQMSLAPDVNRALAKLPERVRYMVTAIHVAGKTEREVAKELGVSRSQLQRQVTAALAEMRAYLGQR